MFARPIAKTQPIATKDSSLTVVGRPACSSGLEASARPSLDAQRQALNAGSSRNLASLPIHAASAPVALQPKLAVGRTDDPLEHEADRIADHVMRASAPAPLQSVAPALTLHRTRASSIIQRAWSDAPTSGAKSNVVPNAPAGGWNQGEAAVAELRRIPVENIGGGNAAKDPQSSGAESADNRAIAILPATLDVTQPADVLLHLHGHNVGYRQQTKDNPGNPAIKAGTVRDIDSDRIEQQIAASQRPIVGILPQGTGNSGFGNLNSDAYIAAVFQALTALGAWGDGNAAPPVGRVIMSGHSGAGGRISEMMSEPGAPRLSSQLAEIALFDSINGPGELGIVTKWVLGHLDQDLAALNAAASTSGGELNDQQTAYLQTSMRFIAYYSNGYYRPFHETLQHAIDAWFKAHGLAGPGNPLADALRANYRTVPVGHGNHNEVVGKGDHLTDALTTLPPATSVTQSVQPKSDPYGHPDAAAPALVETTLRAPGARLDTATRGFMEQRFGRDFSRVRIHADSAAADSAAAISARAYTLGDQIVFGAGAYAPHSDAGRHLLAHELTHVVQQGYAGATTVRRDAVQQNPAPIRADENKKAFDTSNVGDYLVYVPTGVHVADNTDGTTPDLKIHIFFSAGGVQGEKGNDVLTHGLRGASSGTDWILIAVPTPGKITDADIKTTLAQLGISGAISAMRLTGHSRGAFVLTRAIVAGDISASNPIDRVTLLDADEVPDANGVTQTPKSQMLVDHGIPAAKIVAYEVNVRKQHTAGVDYRGLDPDCIAALGYVRLIQDAMVTEPGVAAVVKMNPGVVEQLNWLKLKPRGFYTSKPAPDPTSLAKFCADNKDAIAKILERQLGPKSGLLTFINNNDLARFGGSEKWDQGLSAHHFFVAEIAHELTE